MRHFQALYASLSARPVATLLACTDELPSGNAAALNVSPWGLDLKKTLQDPLSGSVRDADDWQIVKSLTEIAKEHYSDGWAFGQREMARVMPRLDIAGNLEFGRTEIGMELQRPFFS